MVLSLILSLHKTHCTHTIPIIFWYFERPNSCRKAFVESIPIFQIKYCISTNCNCAHKEIYLICWKWSSNCCDSKFHDYFSRVLWSPSQFQSRQRMRHSFCSTQSQSGPFGTQSQSGLVRFTDPLYGQSETQSQSGPTGSQSQSGNQTLEPHSQLPRPTFKSVGEPDQVPQLTWKGRMGQGTWLPSISGSH